MARRDGATRPQPRVDVPQRSQRAERRRREVLLKLRQLRAYNGRDGASERGAVLRLLDSGVRGSGVRAQAWGLRPRPHLLEQPVLRQVAKPTRCGRVAATRRLPALAAAAAAAAFSTAALTAATLAAAAASTAALAHQEAVDKLLQQHHLLAPPATALGLAAPRLAAPRLAAACTTAAAISAVAQRAQLHRHQPLPVRRAQPLKVGPLARSLPATDASTRRLSAHPAAHATARSLRTRQSDGAPVAARGVAARKR
eukprot:6308302-Prymnesium_polylepis.1